LVLPKASAVLLHDSLPPLLKNKINERKKVQPEDNIFI